MQEDQPADSFPGKDHRTFSDVGHPQNANSFFHEGRSVDKSTPFSLKTPFIAFNQSHISYNGEVEFGSRIVVAAGGPVAAGAGATFVTSQLEMEELARDEYDRVLEDLRNQDGITNKDVRDFERSAIIKKSLNFVRGRAEQQATIRQSKGHCYDNVKSKVARCLKVQKKTALKKKRGNPYERAGPLSVEPLGLKYDSGSWVVRASEALQPRVLEIHQKEQEVLALGEALRAKLGERQEEIVQYSVEADHQEEDNGPDSQAVHREEAPAEIETRIRSAY